MLIERAVVKQIEYPIFNTIENQVDVIFNDADVITKKLVEQVINF